MISNSTIRMLKRSIADTRRRVFAPVEKAVLKMSQSGFKDPRYLQGNKKSSEVKDGSKND